MIKKIILLFSAGFVFYFFYIYYLIVTAPNNVDAFYSKAKATIFDLGEIHVSYKSVIDISKLEIYECNFKSKKLVYKGKSQINYVSNKYGGIYLCFYYNDSEIYKWSHFSENSWYTYRYEVEIFDLKNIHVKEQLLN